MVQLERVSMRYGRFVAVDDVSLAVGAGEVLGLLGPNGAGKTTIIRMLTGYHSPTSGRVTVAGFDTVRQPMEARRRVGYVPESHPLYEHMRVVEFLRFMARLRGVPAARVVAAADDAIARLNLVTVASTLIGTLSRGFRQRVAIAQGVVHRPDVLILDEPTNGLDPRQIIETRHLIRGLAGSCTVIMTSHILGEIAKTVDRVAVLLRGRLLAVHGMADTPDLEALFLSLV